MKTLLLICWLLVIYKNPLRLLVTFIRFVIIISCYISITQMVVIIFMEAHTLGFSLSKASPTVKHFVAGLEQIHELFLNCFFLYSLFLYSCR